MCEIFVVRENDKDLKFSKTAIEDAIDSNNDGCGYTIFEKKKNNSGYIVKEVNHINYDKEKETYYSKKETKTTYQHDDEYYEETYADYEEGTTLVSYTFGKKRSIIFESIDGSKYSMTLPILLDDVENMELDEQRLTLWEWLNEKHLECNFWYDKPKVALPLKNKKTPVTITPAKTVSWQYSVPTADSVDNAVDKLYEKQLQLQKDQLLIMHFRNATIGRTEENTQPIVSGNFLVIHNGIFTGIGNYDQSDTRVFTEKLDKEFRKEKITGKKAEKEFLDAYLLTVEGWYSMFIYSWQTEKLYYFRKDASFYSSFNNLLLSTKIARFPRKEKEVDSFVC